MDRVEGSGQERITDHLRKEHESKGQEPTKARSLAGRAIPHATLRESSTGPQARGERRGRN